MKNLNLIILLLFFSTIALCQNNHYLVFCAKEGIPGHAFVVFAQEDASKMMTVHHGGWGLYPNTKTKGAASLIIGEVPGGIIDDYKINTKNDFTFPVVVSKEEFNNALSIKNKYASKGRYELMENDCLSFLIEILNLIQYKINIPQREGLEHLPAQFLHHLIKLN